MLRFVRIFFFIISLLTLQISYALEKIDLVYTWVDDSDQDWQKERRETAKKYKELGHLVNTDSNSNNRYRNRDELKYSLRSVLKYANFFNHIYIVTAGQTPKWFKSHPRVTIISHKSIFKNKEHLPTFNSQAIEANLHRIPGLSEYFVYLNDDMFFARPATARTFFTKDGKMLVTLSKNYSKHGPLVPGEIAYRSACKNTNNLLNKLFLKEKRHHISHAAYVFRKSIFDQAERFFNNPFSMVSSHQFRMSSDYTITNGLIPFYAFYKKQAKRSNLRHKMVRIVGDSGSRLKDSIKKIKKECYHVVTFEDSARNKNTDKEDVIMKAFFENFFPVKAPWER